MILGEKGEKLTLDCPFYAGLRHQRKPKIRSKLSQNTKNSEEQCTVLTHMQCFPTHSWARSGSPGSNESAESNSRILSYATSRPRQCWMQKLNSKCKKSILFWTCKLLIFASWDNHINWKGRRGEKTRWLKMPDKAERFWAKYIYSHLREKKPSVLPLPCNSHGSSMFVWSPKGGDMGI